MVEEIDIGREGIFGNPVVAPRGQRLTGTTLPAYREWLLRALRGEAVARLSYQYKTGLRLPDDYATSVRGLADLVDSGGRLWCPGCRERSCEEGVCHGSVLLKAARWLQGGGQP